MEPHERLGDIIKEDARIEGGYTLASFGQKWSEINGAWNPEELVLFSEFRTKGASITSQAGAKTQRKHSSCGLEEL